MLLLPYLEYGYSLARTRIEKNYIIRYNNTVDNKFVCRIFYFVMEKICMKIAVCEDEKVFSDIICDRTEKYFQSRGHNAEISLFRDGTPLVEAVKSGEHYDIIFQDIQLENTDGMETAALVRNYDKRVVIIFVTGLEDRAVEGYAVAAFDYIVKTSLEARLQNVLDRFMGKYEQNVKTFQLMDGNTVIVPVEDILWIESEGRGTAVCTASDRFVLGSPINRVAGMLPQNLFTEVHKSVFVQTAKIKHIGTDTVEMSSGKVLPLSRRKRKTVMTDVMNTVRDGVQF